MDIYVDEQFNYQWRNGVDYVKGRWMGNSVRILVTFKHLYTYYIFSENYIIMTLLIF